MINKKIGFFVFILVVLVQLYVPAKMILDREDILSNGTEFKFKTQPIDPNDPFRGKFIRLRYEVDKIEVEDKNDWKGGEEVYVILKTDTEGFARIQSVSKQYPTNTQDFFKTKVSYITRDSSNKLMVTYPFNRFYMEESKAYDAELAYRKSRRDTSQVAYALVNIKEGEAVLKDVLINGVSIREIVKEGRKIE